MNANNSNLYGGVGASNNSGGSLSNREKENAFHSSNAFSSGSSSSSGSLSGRATPSIGNNNTWNQVDQRAYGVASYHNIKNG